MRSFETLPGVKINIHKTEMVTLQCLHSNIEERTHLANLFGCTLAKLPQEKKKKNVLETNDNTKIPS